MVKADLAGPGKASGYGAAAIAAMLTAVFASFLPQVLAGEVIQFGLSWAPSLGIGFTFLIDGLSLLFALLISGIGTLIFLYASGYLEGHPRFNYFILCLFSFMLAMLGLVLARDILSLFLFWELTAITSWLLIGFEDDKAEARRNALQSLLVTSAGGLALLAGLILLGQAAGSYDLAVILQAGSLTEHALYTPILILVLLGAFTKSAQFPFHFWLPGAMAAPTPVSAFLHSATMVKAGIYLMARLHPSLSGSFEWETTLTLAGGITAVWAALQALRQTDLKQALAQTTLMALGVATLMLAFDSPEALTAAITFIVVHALYKAALFMVVGAVDHGCGSRDVNCLGALRHAMPVTALAAAGAALSMAGLPPMLGWMGKELLYLAAPEMAWGAFATAALLAANALVFAVAGVVALAPFYGPKPQIAPPHEAHEAGWLMKIGPVLLAILGLFFGLTGSVTLQPLLDQTLQLSFAQERAAPLHLWGGVNLAFGLSLATFALGTALYMGRSRLRAALQGLDRLPSFDRGWDHFLNGFKALASAQTAVIQTGRLSQYLTATFVVLLATFAVTLHLKAPSLQPSFSAPILVWLISGFTAAGALLAVFTTSRIAAIAGIGTVGIGVALTFIYFGAPDVATTQLMVETLSAVLFGIAVLRLPGFTERRRLPKKLLHGAIAVGLGTCFTLIMLTVTSVPLDRMIADYFEQHAYLTAHGRNIVNVVLVDFRAFDTYGELTVVMLAGIGAWALLKRKESAK